MPHLSVVIPVYNSAATIKTVVGDCFAALGHIDFELVLVNDGSVDNSEEVIFNLAETHPNIKAISLAKNVGEFNAVMCGLNYATADYVAIIDDDGQNPPSEILKLLAEAEKGYDVVYARYSEKMHSRDRNLGSWLSNLLAVAFIGKPFKLYLSSFKVLSRKFLDEVLEIQTGGTYLDGLIFQLSPKYSFVVVEHKPSLIPSRYDYSRLTGTTLSMMDSGKNKYAMMLLLVVMVPVFWFFAMVSIMSDQPVGNANFGIFTGFICLLFLCILLFLVLLVSAFVFKLKIRAVQKEFKQAKKSFNA
ncbi:MAG: glycosyltransferase family 2 protein [Sphingobacteriales bacterium JAD_PAG50586_3]|nr:MAG: glycosyltransferase family 2 protein [Sphingobacteriales bacterium JAD_PAG50586_3]